jgi:hypothetical protein
VRHPNGEIAGHWHDVAGHKPSGPDHEQLQKPSRFMNGRSGSSMAPFQSNWERN